MRRVGHAVAYAQPPAVQQEGRQRRLPLIIRPAELKYEESSYDKDFVAAMIDKLEWDALLKAVAWIRECPPAGQALPSGGVPELPTELREEDKAN